MNCDIGTSPISSHFTMHCSVTAFESLCNSPKVSLPLAASSDTCRAHHFPIDLETSRQVKQTMAPHSPGPYHNSSLPSSSPSQRFHFLLTPLLEQISLRPYLSKPVSTRQTPSKQRCLTILLSPASFPDSCSEIYSSIRLSPVSCSRFEATHFYPPVLQPCLATTRYLSLRLQLCFEEPQQVQ